MSYINWKIKSQDQYNVNRLSSALGCSDIVSRMLINRGLTDVAQACEFLNPDAALIHDPFLLNDMDKATERIMLAIKNHEKICIYGDYDVDGITSVSVLYMYLTRFTNSVEYFIPDRFSQGYGVNENAIKNIADEGCNLIITVDTGISAIEEIDYASTIGVDVIITDHHECQDVLPNAVAIINPKRHDSTYPFSKLAGVGVVYKLISAVDKIMSTNFANEYLDLVSIGTIADIMPLLDENRYIVKRGIEKIQTSPNPGLKNLVDICITTQHVTSASIGFAIAPRINAAGRMKNAEVAVKLFITRDSALAHDIAEHLCDLNIERQKTENTIYNEAIDIIEKNDLDNKYNALVLWKEGWHSGVVGIVASRLKDKYNKPVVLFSVDDVSKGSGRSVAPFNLYEAFESCKDLLLQFGGHKYAAGVLIENDKLYQFRDRLSDSVGNFRENNIFSNSIDIECVLPQNLVSLKTVSDISFLQPYGKSNEVPLFCIRNVKICDVFPTSNTKHLRIKFLINNKSVTAFYFGISLRDFDHREGDIVDVVCELNANKFKNIESVQLFIRDMRYCENQLASFKLKRSFCNTSDNIIPMMLPTRNDIASVYRFFSLNYSKGRKQYNLDTIQNMINKDFLVNLNYEQVYFALTILMELGVFIGEISDNILNLHRISEGKKFVLTDSEKLLYIYDKAGVKFGD